MKHLNLFLKGAVGDLDYSLVPKNNWTFPTTNIRIVNKRGQGFVVTSLDGDELLFESDGYIVMAAAEHRDIVYFVSVKDFSGTYKTKLSSYPSPVAYTSDNLEFEDVNKPLQNFNGGDFITELFGYDLHSNISLIIDEAYDESANLYLCDGVHSDKVVNVGFRSSGESNTISYSNSSFEGSINHIPYSLNLPDLSLKLVDVGGVNRPGMYYLYFRYETASFDGTRYYSCQFPIMVAEGTSLLTVRGLPDKDSSGSILTTNKKIVLDVNSLDTNYTFLRVGIVRYYGDDMDDAQYESYGIANRYSIASLIAAGELVITGREDQEVLTLDQLYKIDTDERISKDHIFVNERIWKGNIKRAYYDKNALAEFATRILAKPVRDYAFSDHNETNTFEFIESGVNLGKGEFMNEDPVYNRIGLMPRSIYPYSAVFLLNDGTYSEAFPITGYEYKETTPFYQNPNTKGCVITGDDEPRTVYKTKIEYDTATAYMLANSSKFINVKSFMILRGERFGPYLYSGYLTRTAYGVDDGGLERYFMSDDAAGAYHIPNIINAGSSATEGFPTGDYNQVDPDPATYDYESLEMLSTAEEYALFAPTHMMTRRGKIADGSSIYVEVLEYDTPMNDYSQTDSRLLPQQWVLDRNNEPLPGGVDVSISSFSVLGTGISLTSANKIDFDTETTDTENCFDLATDTFTANYQGWHKFTLTWTALPTGATGSLAFGLLLDGVTSYPLAPVPSDVNSGSATIDIYLEKDDEVEFLVGTTIGSSHNYQLALNIVHPTAGTVNRDGFTALAYNIASGMHKGPGRFSSYMEDGLDDSKLYGYREEDTEWVKYSRSFVTPKFIGLRRTSPDNVVVNHGMVCNVYESEPTEAYLASIVDGFQISFAKYWPVTGNYSLDYTETTNFDIWKGDNFKQRFFCRVRRHLDFDSNPSASHLGDNSIIYNHGLLLGFFCNSDMNGYVRNIIDAKSENNTDAIYSFYPANKSLYPNIKDWIFEADSDDELVESMTVNAGYTKLGQDILFVGYDSSLPEDSFTKPTRIQFSARYIREAFIDNYRNISISNYQDFETRLGPIVRLFETFDVFCSARTKGVARHFIGKRELTAENANVVLSPSDIYLSEETLILAYYGIQDFHALLKTKKRVYGIDVNNTALWWTKIENSISGNRIADVEVFSKQFMVEQEVARLISILNSEGTTPMAGNGISCGFHEDFGEVYFTFLGGKAMESFIFNEDTGMIVGGGTRSPAYYISYHKRLLTTDIWNRNVYISDVESDDPPKYHGITGTSQLSFIVNGLDEEKNSSILEKIFESMEFRTPHNSFIKILLETDQQSVEYTFSENSSEFWKDAEYKEGRWFVPIPQSTNDDDSDYLSGSDLKGDWLKVTLFFEQGKKFFIRNVVTNFQISVI